MTISIIMFLSGLAVGFAACFGYMQRRAVEMMAQLMNAADIMLHLGANPGSDAARRKWGFIAFVEIVYGWKRPKPTDEQKDPQCTLW